MFSDVSGEGGDDLQAVAVAEMEVDLTSDFSWTRPVPLTSRKLTGPLVRAMALALGLPSTGSKEETLQMIEAELSQKGFNSPDVQVSINPVETEQEQEGLSTNLWCLQLIAARGAFLQVSLRRAEIPGAEDSEVDPSEVSGSAEIETLTRDLEEAGRETARLTDVVHSLNSSVSKLNVRVNELWRTNCTMAREYETAVAEKDNEIVELKRQLAAAQAINARCICVEPHGSWVDSQPVNTDSHVRFAPSESRTAQTTPNDHSQDVETHTQRSHTSTHLQPVHSRLPPALVHYPDSYKHSPRDYEVVRSPEPRVGESFVPRRGRAPPVDFFSGEDEGVRVDEWLPTLLRASTWNKWSEEELLIQLAGHLRGRALQEWNLLPTDQKQTYEVAVSALQERLDPGGKLLAVQDFRHASQKDRESVAEFIRRLERLFQVAYGRDGLGVETRIALLYSQQQERLNGWSC